MKSRDVGFIGPRGEPLTSEQKSTLVRELIGHDRLVSLHPDAQTIARNLGLEVFPDNINGLTDEAEIIIASFYPVATPDEWALTMGPGYTCINPDGSVIRGRAADCQPPSTPNEENDDD